MKTKFIKISVLVLSLALVLGAAFAMNISADGETPATKPTIISQNVFYTDQFALMLAVDASTVAPGDVTLYVYEEHPLTGAEASQVKVATSVTSGEESGLGTNAYIFQVNGVGALNLTKDYYFVAVDSAEKESDVLKYSVAEYLYQRLATTGDKAPNDAQKRFYNRTIAFAAGAQMALGDAPLAADSPELISNLRYVEIVGGAINGFTKALVPTGKAINPKAANAITADWKATTYKADGTSTDATSSGNVTLAKDADATKTVISLVDGSQKYYKSLVNESGEREFLVNTYESKTLASKFEFSVGTAMKGQYKYDPVYGMVASSTYSAQNDGIYFNSGVNNLSTKITSLDNATAVEFSFDMKMDYPCDDTNTKNDMYILPSIRYTSASGTTGVNIARYGFTYYKGYLKLYNPSSGAVIAEFKDIDPTEWIHVRMVVYAGDTNMYYYINGSDTPIVAPTTSSFDGVLSRITYGIFLIDKTTPVGAEVQFDNNFFGYTLDALN